MSRGADRGAEEANSVGVNQGQLQEAIGELLFVTASESALRRDSLQRLLPPHLLLPYCRVGNLPERAVI